MRVISGRNHSRCERICLANGPRTRSCAIHHSQHNPMGVQPSRRKRNASDTRAWEQGCHIPHCAAVSRSDALAGVSFQDRLSPRSFRRSWKDRRPLLLKPKHACLRHCLNRKRFHTLWTLLRLQIPKERVRVRLANENRSQPRVISSRNHSH